MSSALPIFFLIAAGICLSLVLLWLWQSLRLVLARDAGLAAPGALGPQHRGRAALLHEKQELLTVIRDLRAEHELGKLSQSDYRELEQRYRARAREVLGELDAQIAPYRERARTLLERELGEPSSASIASTRADATAQACAGCTTSNDLDAVFCKKCGARLKTEAAP